MKTARRKPRGLESLPLRTRSGFLMIFSEKPLDFSPQLEVAACYCEDNGKFLLLQRADNKPQGGKWNLPAGKFEQGETAEQCIIREISEETGALLDMEDLHSEGEIAVRHNGYDFIFHMFRAPFHGQTVAINPREHQRYAWVTPVEALTYDLIEDEDSCIRMVYKI